MLLGGLRSIEDVRYYLNKFSIKLLQESWGTDISFLTYTDYPQIKG